MKILQIVETLNNGAVENWLVSSFLEITKQRPNWQWTFFCILDKPGKLDGKVRDNGGQVIYSPNSISEKSAFLKNLRKITNESKFDIIHTHHDYMNAFYLMSFYRNNAFKISHIHNTDKQIPIKSRLINKMIIPCLKLVNNLGYDRLIGISTDTIKEFKISFRQNQSKDILYYGIELKKFEVLRNREEILKSLNWPNESIILLFIGRFTPLKNPGFLIEIMNQLHIKSSLPFRVLFVGEGDEREKIAGLSKKYGLVDKIHISGWVNEPEQYFKLADVFVFPRVLKPTEGFGMVMLEAQASGIQTVVSTGVLPETIYIDEIVHVLDNDNNPSIWAEKIIEVYPKGHLVNSVDKMAESKFNILNSSKTLIEFYEKTKCN
jgi:glycosyltransferase involved in cell wall biosynthesis